MPIAFVIFPAYLSKGLCAVPQPTKLKYPLFLRLPKEVALKPLARLIVK
jgi:hypothetical protein